MRKKELMQKVGGFYQRSQLIWMKRELKSWEREGIIGVKRKLDVVFEMDWSG